MKSESEVRAKLSAFKAARDLDAELPSDTEYNEGFIAGLLDVLSAPAPPIADDEALVEAVRERDALKAEREAQDRLLLQWSEEGRKHIARLREIDALKAALEPFADGADEIDPQMNATDQTAAWNIVALQEWLKDATVGEFRRARAAIRSHPQPDDMSDEHKAAP